MSIADSLAKLIELKNQLVANLKSMGVAADESEKLNTLVPKVLECNTEQIAEFVEGANFASGINCAISKITIPDTFTSIGWNAFNGCTSLKIVTIPDSVTSIGHHAFYGCTSLKSITIPDSVTNIGKYAFYTGRHTSLV